MLIEETIGRSAERIATVPERGEMPFLTFAEITEEVSGAVVSLIVGYYFLNEIIPCGVVHIHEAPEVVGIITNGVIHGRELIFNKPALNVGILFGGIESDAEIVNDRDVSACLFLHTNLIVFVIVVELDEIATGSEGVVRLIIGQFGDVYSVFLHTDRFGEEIEATVVAVNHHLYGLHTGRPGKPHTFTEVETGEILEVSFPIVCMSEDCVVFTFRHSEH